MLRCYHGDECDCADRSEVDRLTAQLRECREVLGRIIDLPHLVPCWCEDHEAARELWARLDPEKEGKP